MVREVALASALLLAMAALGLGQSMSRQELVMRLRQAESLERAGELDRALEMLGQVLEVSPAEPRAILAVERVNRRLRHSEETLVVAQRAKQVSPGAAVPREVELRVLAELGRFEDLSEAGEDWLRASPGSEQAYREFATILRRNGVIAEAEAVLRRGRDAVERPTALSSELADLFVEQSRWREAAAEWASILRETPGLGWDLISFKLERLGPRAGPAAEALIVQLAGGSATPLDRMVVSVAAIYADRPDVARREAASIIGEMSPAQRDKFISQLARVASRRSQPEMVAWSYRLLLPHVTEDSVRFDLARQIVQYDLSAGDTISALDILSEVLERSGSHSRSHQWASAWEIRLLAAATQPRRAEKAFERHVSLYPQDRSLLSLALVVAAANVRKGRLKEADRVLSSVPDDPTDPHLQARMAAARGYLALYAGHYDDARTELEAASAALAGAERGEALRFLGYLRNASEAELDALADAHRAHLQDRPGAAYDELMSGLRVAPASQARPGLLLLAGDYAIEAGAVNRAEAVLRRIPEEFPEAGEAPVALMTLADALAYDAERRDDAIELLETLILGYPESALTPIARRRLAEIRQQVPRS